MYYQELFDHMSREHGLTLLRSEMHEIELIVAREQNSAMGLGQPVGREADREFEVAWETAGFPWAGEEKL